MATTARPATEEDLLRMPRDGQKYELVDGEIRVSPAGGQHGGVCVRLILQLGGFVLQQQLGQVFDSSTGFRFPGGNIRVPDVSFVARGRLADERPPVGFLEVPPDLAVEVLSPHDRADYALDRVGEYLDAGVRLVWLIDPRERAAVVHRSLTEVRRLGPEDFLDGEDVVPDFRCRLADVID